MDSHPKKRKKKKEKKETSTEQIRNQTTITSLVEKIKPQYKSKSKPNPITQYCNTDLLIKKKKNPIQSKPNPKPRANQTHGETITSLAGATSSVACRPHLVVVARPPFVIARRLPLIADRSWLLQCSVSRYFSLFFSLTLSQSLTHSLSLSISLK